MIWDDHAVGAVGRWGWSANVVEEVAILWNMALYDAHKENNDCSVSSTCIGTGIKPLWKHGGIKTIQRKQATLARVKGH